MKIKKIKCFYKIFNFRRMRANDVAGYLEEEFEADENRCEPI